MFARTMVYDGRYIAREISECHNILKEEKKFDATK